MKIGSSPFTKYRELFNAYREYQDHYMKHIL